MTWDPSELVISGRYSSAAVREDLVQGLAAAVGCPAGVITFSRTYVLPSLSRLVLGSSYEEELLLVESVVERARLRDVEDPTAVLQDVITDLLKCEVFAIHRPNRVGDLGVVIVWPSRGVEQREASAKARALATAVLGSFIAASHRDNALDRELIKRTSRPMRLPQTGDAHSVGSLPTLFGRQRMHDVAELCIQACSASAGAVYEWEGDKLSLLVRVGGDSLPRHVKREDGSRLPPVEYETGMARFDHPADCIWMASNRNQRLIGRSLGNTVLAAPFGSLPNDRQQPAGVFVMLYRGESEPLDAHQLNLIRNVCARLARNAADRRWYDGIARLSRRVSDITNGEAHRTMPAGMADTVHRRRDLRMLGPIVADVLTDLVNTTGAASATCRIVVGSGTEVGERGLARITCTGDGCELGSPDVIAIDQGPSRSVNSWVARSGEPCYIRSIAVDDDGNLTADELSDYPELTGVEIFREGIKSELCVPVIAERRLVGTINLESKQIGGFDESALAAQEYAHTVGLAVVMARREVGVEMLDAAGGFLDRRHEIESKVARVRRELNELFQAPLGVAQRDELSDELAQVESLLVGADAADLDLASSGDRSVRRAIEIGIARLERQTGAEMKLTSVVLDSGDPKVEALLDLSCDAPVFAALAFALGQALVNSSRHGLANGAYGFQRPIEWSADTVVQVLSSRLGGQAMIIVSVENFSVSDDLADLPIDCVFREPLEKHEPHRVELGAYLAGEALRRVGGAAFFRVSPGPWDEIKQVSAEFSVPT